MPKRLAGTSLQHQKVSRSIAGEGDPRIRRQYACARATGPKFMGPANLAGFVIDRFEYALAPQPIVRTRPTVGTIRRFVEIEAVGGMGTHNEQARLGVKAG